MSVTSGKAWRERRVIEKTLPTGDTVLLRPLNGSFLLRMPNIPDRLTGIVVDLVGEGKRPDLSQVESLAKWFELMGYIAKAMFVSPRIVDTPQAEDEISMEDIDDEVRLYLMQTIGMGVRELESFRPQQAVHVDNVENVSGTGGDSSLQVSEPAPMGE